MNNPSIEQKIIQHDPTEQKHNTLNSEPLLIYDIDKIPNEIDDYQEIEVKLKTKAHVIKDLKRVVAKRLNNNEINLNHYLLLEIEKIKDKNEMLDHVGSLSFGGSFPRKDVLEKLYKFSLEIESWPEFPDQFKRRQIEGILKKVIGYKDPRTFSKYLDCIKHFVEHKTGKQTFFESKWDLMDFKEAIQAALVRNEI